MDLFGSVKNFLKPSRASIDNFAFKLTYKFTFALLISSSVLVTARQYFGDPIDCISRDNIPSGMLDTFCWCIQHSVYPIPGTRMWERKCPILEWTSTPREKLASTMRTTSGYASSSSSWPSFLHPSIFLEVNGR
ncbi:hypothetical protein CEXT_636711 [Caerostris extrusa]|uniref:Innexin n=1 Tax=Caerostris extrusa TaxID=172846 RepID=A0AAV4QCD8_CAEEX|nr:hypothetical protein CEXT_636711 [Caerostris extrusa]